MEADYLQLRDLLDTVDGLSLIDEDTGQLEAMLNGEDTYPITFPAALINFNDTEWKTFGGEDEQLGTGTFTVRLAFDQYDDTYSGAEQDKWIAGRDAMRLAVHRAIHRVKSATSGRPFLRVTSRSYSLPGRIKVYEQTYGYSTVE